MVSIAIWLSLTKAILVIKISWLSGLLYVYCEVGAQEPLASHGRTGASESKSSSGNTGRALHQSAQSCFNPFIYPGYIYP